MKKMFAILLFIAAISVSGRQKDSIIYYSALDFKVYGKLYAIQTESPYDRLPLVLKDSVRKELWDLGKCSSGLYIRFQSNSPLINIKWEVLNNTTMNHFAPSGIKGLDLYSLERGNKWRFVGSARPSARESTSRVVSDMDGKSREYMLYLPIYDGLVSLEIGTMEGSSLKPSQMDGPETGNPIVVYGTSITQGGCASRPGMTYTSLLSRRLGREFINLGFSGNGRLDYEIAELIANQPSSLIVIDCLANCTEARIKESYEKFIGIIRAKQPDTPILLLGLADYTNKQYDTKTAGDARKIDRAAKDIYGRLAGVDKNIYYLSGEGLIGADGEATVDATHFTDLGFFRMAQNIEPLIGRILKKTR